MRYEPFRWSSDYSDKSHRDLEPMDVHHHDHDHHDHEHEHGQEHFHGHHLHEHSHHEDEHKHEHGHHEDEHEHGQEHFHEHAIKVSESYSHEEMQIRLVNRLQTLAPLDKRREVLYTIEIIFT